MKEGWTRLEERYDRVLDQLPSRAEEYAAELKCEAPRLRVFLRKLANVLRAERAGFLRRMLAGRTETDAA
jgi:hypothetical protein